MKKKLDTVTYDLTNKGKVVYKGTTNDLGKRKQEHAANGKVFSTIRPTSRKMTEDGAMKKEAAQLATFRKNHGGKNPQYNKDKNG